MGKKRKLGASNDDFEFDPIPRHLVTSHIKKQEKRLIVILENAHLETVGVKKITMSFSSKMVKTCRELVPQDEPIVIIVGAMAHGKVEVDYSEDVISISNYPLSAALTCSKLCSAFEEVWGVV